jgi:hypothetical protein
MSVAVVTIVAVVTVGSVVAIVEFGDIFLIPVLALGSWLLVLGS